MSVKIIILCLNKIEGIIESGAFIDIGTKKNLKVANKIFKKKLYVKKSQESDVFYQYNLHIQKNNENGKEISGKGTNLNFNNRFFGLLKAHNPKRKRSTLGYKSPVIFELVTLKKVA